MGLESPQHECGVLGVVSPGRDVDTDLYYGMITLQNRGQENCGAATFDTASQLHLHKGKGLVYSVFSTDEDVKRLEGSIGVAHIRYGTTGGPSVENAQPFIGESDLGQFAFVQNGNIFNALELRSKMEGEGVEFISTSDGEVMAQYIAHAPGRSYVEKIQSASRQFQGAYSCLIATPHSLIAFRDPHGVWPLSLGKINGSGFVLASETNAIEKIGGKFIEDVPNGEIMVIDSEGISRNSLGKEQESLCSFEFYYFSDPYSKLLGRRVEDARYEMGRLLAKEHQFNADLVLPIPETARPAAEGYSAASGIPLRSVLIRNRWLGRTFIEPNQRLRESTAALKYGVLSEIVEGKSVNVVDDSIVRGTTTLKIVRLLRHSGAKEVNVLITAPEIIRECWLGVDTAEGKELIAATKSVGEIRDFIEADRLGFLSLESGIQAIGSHLKDRLCKSCFTGNYQMQVPEFRDKFILAR